MYLLAILELFSLYRYIFEQKIKNHFELAVMIKLGECGSDLHFPRARAPEYSAERGQAYLLSSGWVQE
jgi:hypothetical protein